MAIAADFARMPTRQKVMVFVITGILLGLLYRQFVLKSLDADIAEAENENNSKKGLNRKLEADIPEFERLKARQLTLNRIIDENQKALPSEAELPAFFETLNRKILESGVEVIRSNQRPEEPVESFFKVPIEYEIQGTYSQIKRFFASLVPKKRAPGQALEPTAGGEAPVEERERIVSIENVALFGPTVRNREIRLTARFTASTFRQEERAGAPPPPRPAAPKPAPPPPPPPATGTAPPASTPKAAKAQTEQALDKGDKKDRDAAGVNEAKTPAAGAKEGK